LHTAAEIMIARLTLAKVRVVLAKGNSFSDGRITSGYGRCSPISSCHNDPFSRMKSCIS
jgi:hypothetical protein